MKPFETYLKRLINLKLPGMEAEKDDFLSSLSFPFLILISIQFL
jgi:hypothetical protein